jgi:hypothetical protein
MGYPVNAQTSTYQVLAADFAVCKAISVASGTFTVTLVASTSQPASGQCVLILNYGTGVVTVARSGQNINGAAANITLAAGSSTAPTSLLVISDGTNYIAQGQSATLGVNAFTGAQTFNSGFRGLSSGTSKWEFGYTANAQTMASDRPIAWSSTTAASGTLDVGGLCGGGGSRGGRRQRQQRWWWCWW